MLINYFLILIVLLLVSGLTLDAGLLEWRTISLQTAADAAAQEGMLGVARYSSTWATDGLAQATQNGFTTGTNNVTVSIANPPTSGAYAGDSLAVQATISQSVSTIFMGLVNGGKATVSATSVARVLPTCIWIMSQAGGGSNPTMWLASAGMGSGCGVYVNTATGKNLGVDGFAALVANRIRVRGAASDNKSVGSLSPLPRFSAAPKNDPLAYVTAPTFSSCTYTNYTANNGTYTLSPGTYCGGLGISGSTVTFSPGLYIITGATTWQHCQLYGSGVTFYFTQGGGSNYGAVSLSYVSTSMSAPTSSSGGGIPGVIIFGDRNAVAHNSQYFSINQSTIVTDGIWYILNTGINVQNTHMNGTNYFGLVVDNIYEYLGNINGSTNYAPLNNVSPFHYEDGALVQ